MCAWGVIAVGSLMPRALGVAFVFGEERTSASRTDERDTLSGACSMRVVVKQVARAANGAKRRGRVARCRIELAPYASDMHVGEVR